MQSIVDLIRPDLKRFVSYSSARMKRNQEIMAECK